MPIKLYFIVNVHFVRNIIYAIGKTDVKEKKTNCKKDIYGDCDENMNEWAGECSNENEQTMIPEWKYGFRCHRPFFSCAISLPLQQILRFCCVTTVH